MSDENGEGREERMPREEPVCPVPPPEGDRIDLSIEERGMVVAPDVPLPTNKVDIGNLPSADARPAEGDGGGSGQQGGGGEATEG